MQSALSQQQTQPIQTRPPLGIRIKAPSNRQLQARKDLPIPKGSQLLRGVEQVLNILSVPEDTHLLRLAECKWYFCKEKLMGYDSD